MLVLDVVPRKPEIIGYCTALYDFSASEPNQLSFSVGDKIAVVSKTGRFKLWWRGSLNGQVGPPILKVNILFCYLSTSARNEIFANISYDE